MRNSSLDCGAMQRDVPGTSFDANADEDVERHRDGSVRARGPLKGGQPDGYKVTSMGDATQG